MVSTLVFLFFVLVTTSQSLNAQCIGALGVPRAASIGAPYGEVFALGPATLAASGGGNFVITSISPIAPTGVYVTSEGVFEGPVAVVGKIPFLGAVALEGQLPTLGIGAVSYGCGNGNIAITNEGVAGPGYGYPEPYSCSGYGYGGYPYGLY